MMRAFVFVLFPALAVPAAVLPAWQPAFSVPFQWMSGDLPGTALQYAGVLEAGL